MLQGAFRDRIRGPLRDAVEAPWRPNLVVWSALDLVGLLLCNRTTGVTYLAVGAGDPAWDANPPGPDRARRQLTAETCRVRLEPGDSVLYDAAAGKLHARVTLGPGHATGTLRELGLFGGGASSRPGSGVLVNHAVHAPLQKGDADTLERELVLTLEQALAPGARDLVGGLLARQPGVAGLTHVALGTGAGAPADPEHALAAEAYRKRLDPHRLAYDAAAHAVEASAAFDVGEGPAAVHEAGLFGGNATDAANTGLLVVRDTGAVDRSTPKRLERRFRLVLVEKTGVAVPALAGLTLDRARAALAGADLQLGTVTGRETDAGANGIVLDQAPAAAVAVNEGTPVAVVVSVRPTVAVPEIVGAPEDQATAFLQQLGLAAAKDGRVEQESTVPAGTVLAAAPPPGTRVVQGTAVALTVAVPVQVLVPDVRGRTPAAAQVVLGAAGLALAPAPYETEETGSSPGSIVVQAPDPGGKVAAGTVVKVTLATPWTVEVPDVSKLALDDAQAALATAAAGLVAKLGLPPGVPGLTLGAVAERADPGEIGTVLEQSPAAKARASLYATVDVVVVSPVAGVTVPGLAGLTQTGAVAALTVAGFAAGVVSSRPSDATAGTVIDQEPPAGSSWSRGDRVGMTLAAGRTVLVPDLAGLSLDAAGEELTGLGLAVGATSTRVEEGPPGVVLDQDPAARDLVPPGTAVTLVLRAGVPNVVGLDRATAEAAIQAAGVGLGAETTRESDGPPGIVLAQDPAPGSAVAADTKVALVLSVVPRVEVPSVTGQPLEAATAQVEALGLVLAVVDKEESDQAEGSILKQDPAAGTPVERGSTVSVVIAVARPQVVAVPNVVGDSAADARKALDAAGLTIAIAGQQPTPGAAAGSVVSQDPQAGTGVAPGSTVAVVLASADQSIEVPDVRQQTTANASALLAQASLTLQVTATTPSVVPAGIVLTQDPVAGSRVPAGSVVSVVVSAGGLVVVPQVVNLLQAVAVAQLRGVRLQSDVVQELNLTRIPGTVLSQSPAAGSQVAIGSVVELAVASRLLKLPGGVQDVPAVVDPRLKVVREAPLGPLLRPLP